MQASKVEVVFAIIPIFFSNLVNEQIRQQETVSVNENDSLSEIITQQRLS